MKKSYGRKVSKKHGNKTIMVMIIVSIILVIIVLAGSNLVNAETSMVAEPVKYYKSVSISYGDTLWSIAQEYMDSSQYNGVNDYIDEIKSINNLISNKIISGEKIIVPYYVYE